MSNLSTLPHTATTEGGAAFEAAYLESPNWVTVPRWVQLSGVSPAARELAAELVDGANRVHGDMAPTLDREYLAWVLGVSRYDKITAALRELANIDFLVIYSGGVDSNGNRAHRRDSRTGRALPDTYGLRPNPPDSYTGPRNTTEAYELFLRDRDAARDRAGSSKRALSIPRKSFTRESEFSQITPTPSVEGAAGQSTPPVRDTEPKTAGHAHTPCEGYGHTPCGGCGRVFAGHAHTPELRARARRFDLSPFGREKPKGERDDEPGTGGAAEPPAPGGGHEQAVADLAARLPWQEWAEARNTELVLSSQQLQQVQTAITTATRVHSLDLHTVKEVARHALLQATGKNKTGSPAPYVAGAFSDGNLPGWLSAVCPAELSDTPLPLPTPSRGAENAEAGNTGATAATHATTDGPALPEWCGECNDGEPAARVNPKMRFVGGIGGEMCTCHPNHPARTSAA